MRLLPDWWRTRVALTPCIGLIVIVTFAGQAFAAPGETGSTVVDLVPGTYIVVCLVPVGLTDEMTEPDPHAASHAEEGMVAEVIVE